MKKIINEISSRKWQALSLVLSILAVCFGGPGVMMAVADPVDPNINDLGSPDGAGKGQELAGTQASATQIKRGDLAQPEYDPDVLKFRCHKTVLLTDARTIAEQRTVTDYEVTNFKIGDETMVGKITTAITANTSANSIELNANNFDGNLKLLTPGTTVTAVGVAGYADGSKTKKDGGDLSMYVASNSGTSVILQAINGPAKTEGEYDETLEDMTAPAIPAATVIAICSIAGAESQQEVTPDNAQPRPETVFLQKQILNLVITDHYKKILKKTPWAEKDLKADALRKFQTRAENTLWTGRQKKFKVAQDHNLGEEYVYTSNGALRQITTLLGLDGDLEFKDVTTIQKLQFTDWSEHDEAECYCGKDKIEQVINMDYTKHKDITYTQRKTDLGIVVRDLVSNFGTLHVKYAPALDRLGYRDFMVIIDMKGARYYTNIKKTERTNDMKKDGTGGREASRYIYIEAGALTLRGLNSILVGPSNEMAEKNLSRAAKPVKVVDALPTSGVYDGMLIMPESDFTVGSVTYSADKVYKATVSSGNVTWSEYTGTVSA